MKKFVFILLFIHFFSYSLEAQDTPPCYSALEELSHRFFLEPIAKKDTRLLRERAACYFSGNNNIHREPLMGYAHLIIAADLGDGYAAFDLAERISTDPLVNQAACFNTIAKYYGRAAKKNTPNALRKLCTHLGRKIMPEELQEIPEKDITSDFFLHLIEDEPEKITAEVFTKQGIELCKGNKTINADQLRALALFCVAFHRYPDSCWGADALTDFIIQPRQHPFLYPNNKVALYYAQIAKTRGAQNEAERVATLQEKVVQQESGPSLLETIGAFFFSLL